MVIKRALCVAIVTLAISTTEMAAGATPTGKTFATLTIGATTYTNVTITDVSGGSVFLRHSRGFESLRIESLSPETQQQLDVQPPPPERSGRKKSGAAAALSSNRGAVPDSATPRQRWQQLVEVIDKGLSTGEMVIAIGLPLSGLALMLGGSIWLIVAGFRVSAGWGICCLVGTFLCGLLNLIFILCNWNEAKKPFYCYVGGIAMFAAWGITVPNLVNRTPPPKPNASATDTPRVESLMPHAPSWRVV